MNLKLFYIMKLDRLSTIIWNVFDPSCNNSMAMLLSQYSDVDMLVVTDKDFMVILELA